MPYRQPHARPDVRDSLSVRIRAGADPTRGLRRPLWARAERSLSVPMVYVELDGAVLSADDLESDGLSEDLAFDAAIANLDPHGLSHERRESVHVYRGPNAAEMLLSADFVRQLHREVGAKKILVAIPERGLLLASRVAERPALEEASEQVKRTHAEPLTSWILRVERGELRGRAAPAPPSPKVRATKRRPERTLPSLPKPRPATSNSPAVALPPPPPWMPKSMLGRVAFVLVSLAVLFALGWLRGAANRPRTVVLPSLETLEAMNESSERFERDVDAVRVSEHITDEGLELELSSDDPSDAAVVYIVSRMRREAEQRAGEPRLRAMHGRLTRGQAGDTDLDELAETLERGLRADGRSVRVTVGVGGRPAGPD